MVRLQRIAIHIPPGRIDALARGRDFGYESDFIDVKLGSSQLSVMDKGQEPSDLCVAATRKLEADGISTEKIGLIVVCTQNPDGHGIPHTAAEVHRKLDLPDDCACFDLALGCSGYVYGLGIVKAFMEAHQITRGLFFTADPYSRIIDPEDQATSLLFGDAATVSLLEDSPSGWLLTDAIFATRGSGGDAIQNRSGKLQMNGREVFNFAMTSVPPQIKALLARNELSLGDIDLFALHQGSRYMVEKLRSRLGVDAARVPVETAGIGNTVSSAIPIVLFRHLNSPDLHHIVIAGFGVGLSYASGLLTFAPPQ